MGPLGMSEVFFLLLIGLLLFGPRKLPELGRIVGKGLAEFRRASNELRSTVESEIQTYENSVSLDTSEPRIAEQPSAPPEKSKSDA